MQRLSLLLLLAFCQPALATADDYPVAPSGDIAYVLVTFSDRPVTPPYTAEAAEQGLTQLTAYLNETSYGRVMARSEVFGWYRLKEESSRFCGYSPDFFEAVIKTADRDIDFRRFGVIFIVVDQKAGCGPSNAHPQGAFRFKTGEGTRYLWFGYWGSAYPSIHEFGHDLGLGHAGMLSCKTEQVSADLRTCSPTAGQICNCSDVPTGDRHDPMGAGGTRGFNALHRNKLGFFQPGEVVHVTQSGTYSLGPLELASSAVKALRVIGKYGETLYWVEYRQSIGVDSSLSAANLNGAFIYLPFGISGSTHSVGADSLLVDCTPTLAEQGALRSDVACRKGDTFYDPGTKVSITTTDVTPSLLTVTVNFEGSATPTPPPPSPPIPPERSTNMLLNGGFEEGVTGWSGLPKRTGITSDAAYRGSFSAKIQLSPKKKRKLRYKRQVPLSGAASYDLSAMLHTGGLQQPALKLVVQWMNARGKKLTATTYNGENRSNEWRKVGIRLVPPQDAAKASILFESFPGMGTLYLDNVEFKGIP